VKRASRRIRISSAVARALADKVSTRITLGASSANADHRRLDLPRNVFGGKMGGWRNTQINAGKLTDNFLNALR